MWTCGRNEGSLFSEKGFIRQKGERAGREDRNMIRVMSEERTSGLQGCASMKWWG